MTRKQERTARLDIRVTPEFRTQVSLAASLARKTVTEWVETALRQAIKDELARSARTTD